MPKTAGSLGLRTIDDVDNMSFKVQVVKGSGDDAEVIAERDYEVSKIHNSIIDRVTIYGAKKLLMDRTSDVTDKRDKLNAMTDYLGQFAQGVWEKERQVGPATVSAEVEALAKLKGYTIPQVQKALKKYDKAQRAKVLGNPKVIELAGKIRKEREADTKEVSFDELLKS